MLRPAAGASPLPSSPKLAITEVTDRSTALRFERVLIDGYPVAEMADAPPGSLIDERAMGHGLRAWLATADGVDVSVATAFTHSGVIQVEMVATRPDARGRGYGAAVTWAATLADPTLPAVLVASDDGRPVYERMGFVPLTRWTLWVGMP
jgi:GNAT superfamily N-acetyltransferase